MDGEWVILSVLAHGSGCGNQAPLPKITEPNEMAKPTASPHQKKTTTGRLLKQLITTNVL